MYLSDEQTFCGCLVAARLLGIVRLEKNGEENDRLIGCALPINGTAQTTDGYKDIGDLPDELISSICEFLTEYSADQDNKIDFKGIRSRKSPRARYHRHQGLQQKEEKERPDLPWRMPMELRF